jgi:hypothetical protein
MRLHEAYKYRPQEAATTTLLHKAASPARTKTNRYDRSNELTFTIMEEGTQRMHGLVYPGQNHQPVP